MCMFKTPSVSTFKTSPCVRSKRPRVYQHHARIWKHMCAWFRYTRGRFERTHGGRFEHTHTRQHLHRTRHAGAREAREARRLLSLSLSLSSSCQHPLSLLNDDDDDHWFTRGAWYVSKVFVCCVLLIDVLCDVRCGWVVHVVAVVLCCADIQSRRGYPYECRGFSCCLSALVSKFSPL